MWYCPCPRSFFLCTCPVHSLASATLGQPGPESLRGMAPIPMCCHVPLFVFMPLFIPPRPFLLSPPLWLVAVERDPSPICMLLLHVHGAQEQPSRKLPPSPQWHESCFCWPRSGPFLHMAHVPVQKLSNRRWRWKARRGKVLRGAMRASCQRGIGRFEAPRLQGSATPRPHVPPPSVNTYKLSLPSPEVASFLPPPTSNRLPSFKTSPCSFESSVPTFQHHFPQHHLPHRLEFRPDSSQPQL